MGTDKKKTSLNMSRELARAARIKAAQEDTTISVIVSRALEFYLAQPLSFRPEGPVKRVGKFPVLKASSK